jgi:hypothetical protein
MLDSSGARPVFGNNFHITDSSSAQLNADQPLKDLANISKSAIVDDVVQIRPQQMSIPEPASRQRNNFLNSMS